MNLDKAYESWGQMSDNRELYFKTKTLFRKMWWLIPTNKPCSYYTLDVLGRALVQTNGAQSDKVKAASVMCHVLNFAHTAQPDDNPKPAFGFQDIVDYTGNKPSPMVQAIEEHEAAANTQQPTPITQSEVSLVKVKPAVKAKRMAELAKRDGGEAAAKAAKAVVQLDPNTLKPVKVWKSCHAAQAELGIKNVQRAISRCGKSGGYYWCRPGDEESFKPMDKRANNRVPKAASKREKNDACISSSEREQARRDNGKPLTPEQKQLHKKVFDAPSRQPTPEQQEQLKEAEVSVAKARQELEEEIVNHVEGVLQNATQDELIAELRRRQWKGVLHITQTIEL